MTNDWIEIDGAAGEGGGQILRSSLALSLVSQRPLRLDRIRAGRKKPGLLRQHLTAVRAAAEVGDATVEGADLGSRHLTFRPRTVSAGEFHFAVGTAGSATLVLQTVLPALLTAPGPSHLTLEGGTHNPFAPPFNFLDRAFLPLVRRLGPRVDAVLERPGFYPAGGGRFQVTIEPVKQLGGFELLERGADGRRVARAIFSNLPQSIAQRELKVVSDRLGWTGDALRREEITNAEGVGNVLTLEIESEHITEVFTGFGQRSVPAEGVARQAISEAQNYLKSPAPVGPYLADQLLLPLALAQGGTFRTQAVTQHTKTNAQVIERVLPVAIEITRAARDDHVVSIRPL